MKLPYVLLADDNPEHSDLFNTVFEKHIAYARIVVQKDARSLLSFLADCGWKDLPDLIVFNFNEAAEVLKELTQEDRYLPIPKVVLVAEHNFAMKEECETLGVTHFLIKTENVFDLESNVRRVDALLQDELQFHG